MSVASFQLNLLDSSATLCLSRARHSRTACSSEEERNPLFPFTTTSRGPSTSKAATGVPHAIDSIITRARNAMTAKIIYAQNWRLWWTNGAEETRVYYPKDQYPTPDDCPSPGPGWRRGRSLAYKKKFMEWKDDWQAAMWAGKEAADKARGLKRRQG